MSTKVSNWVWHSEATKTLKAGEMLVMLALADIANDDGLVIFVSDRAKDGEQAALAAKCRMSVATFRRQTHHLQELGLLSIGRESPTSRNIYRLNPTAQSERSPVSDRTAQDERSHRSTVSGHRDVNTKSTSGGSKLAAITIPEFFELTDEMRAWAAEHAPACDVERVTDAFVDYWRNGNGSGKRHKNWIATWRNWMRSEQSKLERFGWKAPAPADEVVVEDNVTQRRLDRERDAWLAAHGLTLEEFEAHRDEPGWLERVTAGGAA